MFPYSLGKEIEENGENLTTRAVAHSTGPLQSSYPFSPAFGFTHLERREKIAYLEAVLALTVLTEYSKSKTTESCQLNGF